MNSMKMFLIDEKYRNKLYFAVYNAQFSNPESCTKFAVLKIREHDIQSQDSSLSGSKFITSIPIRTIQS